MDKLYLCNFKNPKCKDSFFCGRQENGECFHTLFKEFALNPDADDEYFDTYIYENGESCMVERLENEMKK